MVFGDVADTASLERAVTGVEVVVSAVQKTGTSEHGTSNDVGLLWPPGNRPPVLIAAYLTEGAPDGNHRDAALADVGAAIAAAWAVG